MNMYRYEIILYWSTEDAAFIAEVPELPGCMAHGDTQDEALHQAQKAMAAWIEVAQEIGRDVPVPRGRLMYA
jgi:predicted RNase H-like HicB family nuclease